MLTFGRYAMLDETGENAGEETRVTGVEWTAAAAAGELMPSKFYHQGDMRIGLLYIGPLYMLGHCIGLLYSHTYLLG